MRPFRSLPSFQPAGFPRSGLTRSALAVVAVVPLFYGALYVWANWDPTGNLNRVQAAIVNLDQPATVTTPQGKKQIVPLGRVLAGELTGNSSGENFDWVITDAQDASDGLADGQYGAVLTIPKDFSAAATSTSGDATKARQARLTINTNDAQDYLTGAIATSVGTAATDTLNRQVSTTYLENVLVGFSTLHGQLGEAATGATKLSDGARQLADGMARTDDGVGQLVVGLDQLAAGTGRLPGQAAQLNAGARQLAAGVSGLAGGAERLSGGLGRLNAGTQALPGQLAQLDAGAGQVAGGAGGLATGAGQVADGAGSVVSGAQFVSGSLRTYGSRAGELAAGCEASGASAEYCAQVSALADGLTPLAGNAADVAEGATFVRTAAGRLQTGAEQLATGSAQLKRGTGALAASAPALSAGIAQAAGGAGQLSYGAAALAGGAGQLAAGTAQFAAGAPQLSSGIAQAAAGASRLHDGTSQLAAGASQMGQGTGKLASGLSDGARQIPSYTPQQRKDLSTVAVTPVLADVRRVNAVQSNGVGLAPYIVALALWVGALATFMLLRPLSPGALASSTPSWRVALAGFRPGALLVTTQAALLLGVLYFAVGLDAAHPAALFGFGVLVALTFAAINQALVAVFGRAGRFVALILAGLQIATAGGTYPVATAPAFVGTVHDLLPMTYAVEGLRAAVAGGAGGAGGDVAVLLLWAAAALLVTILAAHRRRIWSVARLRGTATATGLT